MNKYLFYEYPIQVSPSLCEEIGVNEAIFLQQLHYRLLRTNQERNGRKWICITYGELQEYSNEDYERGTNYGTNRECKFSNTRVKQPHYRFKNDEVSNGKHGITEGTQRTIHL